MRHCLLSAATLVTLLLGSTVGAQDAPYSVVYYSLTSDPVSTRRMLEAVKQMGATRALTLVYWWRADTLDDDTYWRDDYQPDDMGEGYLRSLDLFVSTCHELGIRPSLRLGSFREFDGYWHPADKTRSIDNYAAWVEQLARRYSGKIDHYIIGDEENKAHAQMNWDGTAATYYHRMFLPLARAIRKGDPHAAISTCGVSSAPATQWLLELIQLGLPQHGDGVAMNLWHEMLDDPWQVEQAMKRIRAAWPSVKFYASGVGYAINRGLDDEHQAGTVARTLFNLWDLGWDSAPYYLFAFSITADTKQNYGLVGIGQDGAIHFSAAARAYKTIARVFNDRASLKSPDFKITLQQAQEVPVEGMLPLHLAPPDPVCKAFVRDGQELLLYLDYRGWKPPVHGIWNITLESPRWIRPQRVELTAPDVQHDIPHQRDEQRIVLKQVRIGPRPVILRLSASDGGS